jgi:hypothetical protein
MNNTERYKILMNIVAQKGIDGDLFLELAKAEQMIHNIEQGKMTPPPLPPELSQPQVPPATPEPALSSNPINTPTQNG